MHIRQREHVKSFYSIVKIRFYDDQVWLTYLLCRIAAAVQCKDIRSNVITERLIVWLMVDWLVKVVLMVYLIVPKNGTHGAFGRIVSKLRIKELV